MSVTVDQTNAKAHGDIVGGDKTVHHHYATSSATGIVEKLLLKLHTELEKNVQVKETIENLQFFQTRRSQDGIDGLEAKLKKANREGEIHLALEKKELFAKLLERWSLYASAQEIFAYLMAKAEYEYTTFILPKIGKINDDEFNQIIHDKILSPTIAECGADIFNLNHSVAMGMIYWLAEQCFVRWHQ